MSSASVTDQQNAAVQAANLAAAGLSTSSSSTSGTASTTSAASSAANSANALKSLTGNFNDFLQLLTTQLQNQDPTNPMDTNQFTSQLVEMANVEQQISTNASLGSLISLTQGSDILQSSSIVGKTVAVSGDQLSLQNSTAAVQFTAPAAEPVAIAVYNSSGTKVLDATAEPTKGANQWTWDGKNSDGTQMPDGAYKVAVIGANADGSTAALTFTVLGTATSVQQGTDGLDLYMGALSVPFSSVQSINPATAASSSSN